MDENNYNMTHFMKKIGVPNIPKGMPLKAVS